MSSPSLPLVALVALLASTAAACGGSDSASPSSAGGAGGAGGGAGASSESAGGAAGVGGKAAAGAFAGGAGGSGAAGAAQAGGGSATTGGAGGGAGAAAGGVSGSGGAAATGGGGAGAAAGGVSGSGGAAATGGAAGSAGAGTAGICGVAGAGGATNPRTLLTRPLYSTSLQNLLLDTFTTSDTSWGHFLRHLSTGPTDPGSGYYVTRFWDSLSPNGMAAPLASLTNQGAVVAGAVTATLLASFAGGTGPFSADVWVTALDASGNPASYAAAAASLSVAIYTSDTQSKYALAADTVPAFTPGTRQWVHLTLPSPAPLAEGGWFLMSVDLTQANSNWLFAAPEVVAAPGAPGGAPALPVTDTERKPILFYPDFVHRHPPDRHRKRIQGQSPAGQAR